ncbi:hypothetical protein H5P36_15815 [Bacillus sp. APMAM]|nr:hypothetical protein [Bacillus sp. APMAM]RTZ55035.1 hypothetical protein EKO25_15065 [Bacillus sp. SAJ1]
MQVQNDSKITPFNQPDKVLQLKEGEVQQALIKEKTSDNEAILQIKGQDVKVKFEGEIPSNGKAMIQIINTNQELPTVKLVNANNQTTQIPSQESSVISDPKASNELKAAINLLAERKVTLDKNSLASIKMYMDKGNGTISQKLNTLVAIANKGLDFTLNQIEAVHTALHDSTYSSTLEKWMVEIDPSFRFNKIETPAYRYVSTNQTEKQNTNIPVNNQEVFSTEQAEQLRQVAIEKVKDVLLQLLMKNPDKAQTIHELQNMIQNKDSLKNIIQMLKSNFMEQLASNPNLEKNIRDAIKLDSISQTVISKSSGVAQTSLTATVDELSQNVQQAKKMIQKVPNIKDINQFIEDKILFSSQLSSSDKEFLNQMMDNIKNLISNGRELAARKELMNALDQLDIKNSNTDSASLQQINAEEAFNLNDDLFSSIPIQSRDIIVTSITKKLSQAAIDFKNIKRDIVNQLSNIQQLTEIFKQNSSPQTKPLLEATIKQLDKSILQGDFMLYTDMETEKKLLQGSSKLQDARKLLNNGEYDKANKIVTEVKNMLEQINFKPSDVRVKHYVSKEFLLEEQPSPKQFTKAFDQMMQTMKQGPSSRQTLEYMKGMGLSYEFDQANSLVTKGEGMENNDSLKGILLKLMSSDGNSQRTEQLLQNITGQQLLSKPDTSGLQSMMFTLPYLIQDRLENIKVILNSKNQSEKIDWEHCSLYFQFETPKLGDVGIQLTAVDRTLNISIKNDKYNFKEKVEPLANIAKERLKDIGYNIGTIQFTTFTEKNEQSQPGIKNEKTPALNMTKGGYDFTI